MVEATDEGVDKTEELQKDEVNSVSLNHHNISREGLDNNDETSHLESHYPYNEQTEDVERREGNITDEGHGFWGKLRKAYSNMGLTVLSIISWYFFSLSISLYNKWMFSKNNLDFASLLHPFTRPFFLLYLRSFYDFFQSLGLIMIQTSLPKRRMVMNIFKRIALQTLIRMGDINYGRNKNQSKILRISTMMWT